VSLAWAAQHLHAWYGSEQPQLSGDEATHAASVLWALSGDAAQRALAAWSFGWEPAQAASGSEWIAPFLAELLDDPYEAVRIIAERSLRGLPGHAEARYDLLGEPAERARAKRETLELWKSAGAAPGDEHRAAVLQRPDGSLRQDELTRLLALRDQRPVSIFE
jgi:hypothetical protein